MKICVHRVYAKALVEFNYFLLYKVNSFINKLLMLYSA